MKTFLCLTLVCAANLQAAPTYTSNQSSFNGGFGRNQNGGTANCGVFDSWLRQPLQSANYTMGAPPLPSSAPAPIAPSLRIILMGSDVRVSWPIEATGFLLLESEALGNGASWGKVTDLYQDDGVENYVIIPAAESSRFYRLVFSE
jgi:hypothetical protein